jgi:NitT/TauT family transport system substrate-binding protein
MEMRKLAFGIALLAQALFFAGSAFGELTVGLMPAYNSIPLVVAEAAGFYKANNVEVNLAPFNGQLERETALQTGAVDGTISDMINAIQSWSHGFGAKVTSVSEGNFSLLASPKCRLATLKDWPKGDGPKVSSGLLENSIVYYLTERMLSSAGADQSRLELVPIVQLPVRLEMLIAGRVETACLPEPLATLAVSRGARVLADTDGMGTTPGVILFTGKALSTKQGEILSFYRAYDQAVDELNARPDRYREVIAEKCGFPPAVAKLMRLGRFRHAFLPPEALVSDVSAWMKGKGLVDRQPFYEDIVARGFLSDHARAK